MPSAGPPRKELKLARRKLPFWWASPGVEDPPALQRVRISACNAQGEPLIVRQGTHVVHDVTLTRLLRHIATKLPPRFDDLLGSGRTKLDASTLLLRPAVHRQRRQADNPVCMPAKSGKVAGFYGGHGDYLHVKLGTDEHGKPVKERVHALICWLRYGPPQLRGTVGGQSVSVAAHAYGKYRCNDRRDCISPSHIEWQTRAYNTTAYYDELRQKKCACAAALLPACQVTCCHACMNFSLHAQPALAHDILLASMHAQGGPTGWSSRVTSTSAPNCRSATWLLLLLCVPVGIARGHGI